MLSKLLDHFKIYRKRQGEPPASVSVGYVHLIVRHNEHVHLEYWMDESMTQQDYMSLIYQLGEAQKVVASSMYDRHGRPGDQGYEAT